MGVAAVESAVEPDLEGALMDAIFWVLAALVIYFLFFRPAG